MLGSSLSEVGLNGRLAEHSLAPEIRNPTVVFNFGIPGAGPVTQLIYLKRLLKEELRPDLIFVEVLPAVLAGPGPMPSEANWLGPERLNLSEIEGLQRYGFPSIQYRSAWLRGWWIPWYSQRFAIMNLVAPKWLPVHLQHSFAHDSCGWAANPARHRGDRYLLAVERARQEYGALLNDLHLNKPAGHALEEILIECRRALAPTALVLMPESTEFRSFYSAAAWEQISNFLAKLSHVYDTPVINAREWIPNSEFSDPLHMVTGGAFKFTRRLCREALLPLAMRTQSLERVKKSNREEPKEREDHSYLIGGRPPILYLSHNMN